MSFSLSYHHVEVGPGSYERYLTLNLEQPRKVQELYGNSWAQRRRLTRSDGDRTWHGRGEHPTELSR